MRRDAKLIQTARAALRSIPGYIKGDVTSVRESGGHYTHAAIWSTMANHGGKVARQRLPPYLTVMPSMTDAADGFPCAPLALFSLSPLLSECFTNIISNSFLARSLRYIFSAENEHSDASASFKLLPEENAMHKQMKQLQQLSGVGKILSQRLVENGYDTISKVAAAQTKGLERISGMHPKRVRTIVAQAREMTGEAEKDRHTWLAEKGEGKARQT